MSAHVYRNRSVFFYVEWLSNDWVRQMRRLLHREFKRGHVAQFLAVLLLWSLVTVLAVSVVHGVRTLPS